MTEAAISARDTRAALRRHVVPLLRAEGFTDGTPSKLWRHDGERIAHVEIACLSTYQALVRNATTASFEVRVALCLPGYGATEDPFHRDHVKTGPKGPRPSEPQMPIRGVICPGDAPPLTQGRWGREVSSLWSVETSADCEDAALDLAAQFRSFALDWLSRDWDYADLLERLQSDQPSPILITAGNGSHLRLDAEMPQSNIRKAHIDMVRAKMADQPHGR